MSESATYRFVCASVAFALIGTVSYLAADFPLPAKAAPSDAPSIQGAARVLDGDTIDLAGTRVRLEGIDAPEIGQTCVRHGGGSWPCGTAAAEALKRLIGGAQVTCSPQGLDTYGRVLGICRIGGRDIGDEMVRNGLAWAFVKYSASYVNSEAEARLARRGVWQAPTQAAWDYRERQWASAESEAPAGCAIKGNVSSKGHIYHMPWSPWYRRVKVDTARGERWFCSEADALAAGWRPAMTH